MNHYAVVFLLRPPDLLRREPLFEGTNVCNSQENGVRARCAAIVNHSAIVNLLRRANLLRRSLFSTAGSFGFPRFAIARSPHRALKPRNAQSAFNVRKMPFWTPPENGPKSKVECPKMALFWRFNWLLSPFFWGFKMAFLGLYNEGFNPPQSHLVVFEVSVVLVVSSKYWKMICCI